MVVIRVFLDALVDGIQDISPKRHFILLGDKPFGEKDYEQVFPSQVFVNQAVDALGKDTV